MSFTVLFPEFFISCGYFIFIICGVSWGGIGIDAIGCLKKEMKEEERERGERERQREEIYTYWQGWQVLILINYRLKLLNLYINYSCVYRSTFHLQWQKGSSVLEVRHHAMNFQINKNHDQYSIHKTASAHPNRIVIVPWDLFVCLEWSPRVRPTGLTNSIRLYPDAPTFFSLYPSILGREGVIFH